MLKKISLIASSVGLALGLMSCKQDGPLLPILGLDKDNKEISLKISEADFGAQFSEVLNSASTSSLNALTTQENGAAWGLQEVEVGVDLKLEGGITTIVNLAIGSGASLTLSRQNAGATHE